jgi:hypothetical protein
MDRHVYCLEPDYHEKRSIYSKLAVSYVLLCAALQKFIFSLGKLMFYH